jgi:hypothetical protein
VVGGLGPQIILVVIVVELAIFVVPLPPIGWRRWCLVRREFYRCFRQSLSLDCLVVEDWMFVVLSRQCSDAVVDDA